MNKEIQAALAPVSPPMSNLGTANGWRDTPAIVENCKHVHDSRKIGRCLTEYSCSICNFKFKVDSGG